MHCNENKLLMKEKISQRTRFQATMQAKMPHRKLLQHTDSSRTMKRKKFSVYQFLCRQEEVKRWIEDIQKETYWRSY